jgi:fibrillarin-like rRNA methylase
MGKSVLLFILYLLLSSDYSYGQYKNGGTTISNKAGILVFEGKEKIYEMYFIEAAPSNLIKLLKDKDTITAILLGSPGDDVTNTEGFKNYLEKSIQFDSVFLLIADINHLGYAYEDTTIFFSKYGSIKFVNSRGYNLSRKYKKVFLNGRHVVVITEYFVPIESFTISPIKNNAKCENN